MRSIVFNVVVAVALVHLLMSDGESVRGMADKAQAAVGDAMRNIAEAADTPASDMPQLLADRVQDMAGGKETTGKPALPKPAPPAPTPDQTSDTEIAARGPAPEMVDIEPIVDVEDVRKVEASEVGSREAEALDTLYGTETAMAAAAPSAGAARLPIPEKPASELFRAPEGTAADDPFFGSDVALAEGTEMMSPAERRRELYDLARDMELLYLENAGI